MVDYVITAENHKKIQQMISELKIKDGARLWDFFSQLYLNALKEQEEKK